MNLTTHCKLVEGKYAVAIYDLERKLIQRINIKSYQEILCNSTDKRVKELKSKLAMRGFINENHKSNMLHFVYKPQLPWLRTMVFNLVDQNRKEIDSIFDICTFAITNHALMSCVIITDNISRKILYIIIKLLSSNLNLIVEIWSYNNIFYSLCHDKTIDKYKDRLIFSKLESDISTIEKIDDYYYRKFPSNESKVSQLVINKEFYHYSLTNSESSGCLYFSKGKVYPSTSEQYFELAQSPNNLLEFEEILKAVRLEKYWSNTKDKREKCNECELRYACTYPNSMRQIKHDIQSAPSSCKYNIIDGRWTGI